MQRERERETIQPKHRNEVHHKSALLFPDSSFPVLTLSHIKVVEKNQELSNDTCRNS